MDEASRAFFRSQLEKPENQACIDYGSGNPQWASVSHGCYISLEASGVHRGLGVHISFVRSTTMDAWKPQQLRMMELGGNGKLEAFFREHGIPDRMPIKQKYNTRAAEWYRKNLRSLADGSSPPAPLPPGTGHLPTEEQSGMPSAALFSLSGQSRSSGSSAVPAGSTSGVSGYHAGGGGAPAPASGGYHAGGGAPVNGVNAAPRGEGQKQSDLFTDILGADVGAKVSGVVGSLAEQAKTFADQTRTGEGGESPVLGKTAQALGSSLSAMGTGLAAVAGQLASAGSKDSSAGLQGMSSGTMQGFGSDVPPASAAPQARSSYHGFAVGDASSANSSRAKAVADLWGDDDGDEIAPSASSGSPAAPAPAAAPAASGGLPAAAAPAGSAVGAAAPAGPAAPAPAPAPTPPAVAKPPAVSKAVAALWNDDDWGDWS